MYPTNILDQMHFENLKPETLQPSVKSKSHISSNIKNIMKNPPAVLSHLLLYPEDQLPQFT